MDGFEQGGIFEPGGAASAVPVALPRAGEPLAIGFTRRPDQDARPLAGGQPMVEVLAVGHGRLRAANRLTGTSVGAGLRVVEVKEDVDDRGWPAVHVVAESHSHGIGVDCFLSSPPGLDVVRAQVRLSNVGTAPVVLQSVTTLAVRICLSGSPNTPTPAQELELLSGRSDWLGEGQWQRRPLRSAGLADLSLAAHGQGARSAVIARSQGSWSTDGDLPVGGLIGPDGETWLWQVESSAGWRWEIGEDPDGCYLALSGPTDEDHQWQLELAPGESFGTVPVALAFGPDLAAATAALTGHRRALRRPHHDNSSRPIIFNDYMNTLMGDPTSERLLPLVDAAAAVGSEVFCIDAGWYDDGRDWWDSVGEWVPSTRRFPHGLSEVLDRVRQHGMTPGLWLEPEVIGVRSPMADRLPAEAFWQRAGVRVVEAGRYHLDLRHPAAREHLDEVVDRLVNGLGIGYFKLDYNIRPGAGTDLDSTSPGVGLLEHTRAYHGWLDAVLDRHPDLVLENCASGAMRMDYELLSRMQLQSTSDQQDAFRYAAIAVAAPMSVAPEQCANWAYPQPGLDPEEAAATLVTGLAGRLYLSGHLDQMNPVELERVRSAVAVARQLHDGLGEATPRWPLGLPGWEDPWLALELAGPVDHVLHLWHRRRESDRIELPLPQRHGQQLQIETLFPTELPLWETEWDPDNAVLTVRSPATTGSWSARTFRLTPVIR